jgi:hypothetical protein
LSPPLFIQRDQELAAHDWDDPVALSEFVPEWVPYLPKYRYFFLLHIDRCLITAIGYWSMKDNVPTPYAIDPLIGEGSSPGKKRKYSHSKSSTVSSDKESNMTSFISDFPISPLAGMFPALLNFCHVKYMLDGSSGVSTTTTTSTSSTDNENDSSNKNDSDSKDDNNLLKPTSTLAPFNPSTISSPQSLMQTSGIENRLI